LVSLETGKQLKGDCPARPVTGGTCLDGMKYTDSSDANIPVEVNLDILVTTATAGV